MDNKYKSITAMLLSILMLSSALMLFVPQEAEAPGPTPDFTLEVTGNNPVEVDVSPRGTGIGTTEVTVTSQSAHTITVDVTIDLAGYIVSPVRSTITLGPDASAIISVSVAALLRSPYRVGTGNVHGEVIRVDGVPVSGYTADTGFSATSKSYGKVILGSDKPFEKVKPGKEYPFKIKVENNGNAVDNYDLEITNKDKLEDKGFSITLSRTTTKDIGQGEYELITIRVQTPRKFWRNEYYTIDIKAISDVDPTEKSEYSITVWVWGAYVPGFEIAFSIIALALVGTFMARRRQD
ncbi:MAG: hypothetical protein KAU14_01995 [Thermoplasmata archaeon]|nr:hypothetical protein [Thermoplasmata archaeon]